MAKPPLSGALQLTKTSSPEITVVAAGT